MAIDYENEELLTVTQAAKQMPTRPAVRTVWRWMQEGCWGTKLESVLIGGRRLTSREAIRRFITATSESIEAKKPEMSARRRQAIERAERELREAGV